MRSLSCGARLLIIFLAINFQASVNADEESPGKGESNWNFSSFHLGPLAASQGGGESLSALIRYTPEMSFSDKLTLESFNIGVDLGFSVLNNSGDSRFSVFEYGVFVSYRISKEWSGRILGGAQTWASNNGTSIFTGIEIFYYLNRPNTGFLSVIDSLYVAYTPVFKSPVAHEFSFGIGVQF